MIDIAMIGCSADERRRSTAINTCRTLDDLNQALLDKGFRLSRSATYLRLIPRRANTTEGKLHVKTVPVKLAKPQNSLSKEHIDQRFCKSTINTLESIASALTSHQVKKVC